MSKLAKLTKHSYKKTEDNIKYFRISFVIAGVGLISYCTTYVFYNKKIEFCTFSKIIIMLNNNCPKCLKNTYYIHLNKKTFT